MLLRQDQEQEYEAEQTYGFNDAHGDDDEDQTLALAFGDRPTAGRSDDALQPGAEHLGKPPGDADTQQRARMCGRVRVRWICPELICLYRFFREGKRSRV